MLTPETTAPELFELNGEPVKEGAQFTLIATGKTFVFTAAASSCDQCALHRDDGLCPRIRCVGGIWTTPTALLNYKISGELREPSSI